MAFKATSRLIYHSYEPSTTVAGTAQRWYSPSMTDPAAELWLSLAPLLTSIRVIGYDCLMAPEQGSFISECSGSARVHRHPPKLACISYSNVHTFENRSYLTGRCVSPI